ncbi:MAG: twin-arginine translocation signal domain-containing protein, partial [Dehalococcoidia bacterium]|nr:twin-arginine translocation signal domain-containing protein [Dehalococcoidia bacterium]
MDLSRREFLRAAGAASVSGVLFAGCAIPEREIIKQSPRDLPEDLAGGLEDWYATSCAFCGDAHGIIVRVVEGRAKKIEGNPDHPVNRGGLMARCLMGVQSHYHPDRLNGAQRTDGTSVDWATAVSELSTAITE